MPPYTEMPKGYCFEYAGNTDWQSGVNDDWNIEIYSPTGKEQRAGSRFIDGSRCIVFQCPDGKFRAVTAVSIGT